MLPAWTAGPLPLPALPHRACGAICRGIAGLLPVPAPTLQRFRWSSCAPRPDSETSGNIVFSPRVVPFPRNCAHLQWVNSRVQSTRPEHAETIKGSYRSIEVELEMKE